MALQLTSFICTQAYNNVKDRARIQYGLSILLSEGFKIVFLVLFFNIIHVQKYFYFSLLVLLSTRVFAGGVHVKGALNCLLLTTLLFIFTSVLAPLMPRLLAVYYLPVSIASFVIVLIRAPICCVRSPVKDNKKKLQYKYTAALSIVLWTTILLFLKSPSYINCGFSTILIQNIQLVLVKKPTL
ncbi:accessory gene regulator B family protein [Clostridium sp. CF012]|uniref:accessory gene regulator B family protein n=1 Tax=Clostridium sp. CF012 TaxID=2843319 RepID=UPI00209AF370|nr:accessory gene regulator B family protein [Clostridium sp. CF012]